MSTVPISTNVHVNKHWICTFGYN